MDTLPWARRLFDTRRIMSNGRSEKRIARTVNLEVCLQDEPKLNDSMLTENVSAHGARVLVEQKLQPGQRVLVNSPRRACGHLRGSSTAIACPREGLLSVWNYPGGWNCGQRLTSCTRSRFLRTCQGGHTRAHAPIFFPNSPEVSSSLILLSSHSGHFHRRKLLLSGITSAKYMRCPSLEQLT